MIGMPETAKPNDVKMKSTGNPTTANTTNLTNEKLGFIVPGPLVDWAIIDLECIASFAHSEKDLFDWPFKDDSKSKS